MKADLIKRIRKTVVRGSLVCLSLIMLITPQAALAKYGINGLDDPRSMDLSVAKNGVVRVEAVTEDDSGNEKVRATSSGFIVSIQGSTPYVVTTLHAVDYGNDTKIRVIIKNDTYAEARLDSSLESYNKDFCILRVDGQLGSKNAIPLRVTKYDREDDMLASGADVTLLGFSSSLSSNSDFSANDVTAKSGKLTGLSNENGGYYKADIETFSGADGGVLVDADGYAIGLVNVEAGSGTVTALDVADIESLLDSAGISCRTKDKDLLYNELYDLYEAYSTGEINYKKGDKASREAIKAAYRAAEAVLSGLPYDRDALTKALNDFQEASDSTRSRFAVLLNIAVIVLGLVMIILLIRLLSLNRWYKKNAPSNGPPGGRNGQFDPSAGAYDDGQRMYADMSAGTERSRKKRNAGDRTLRPAPAAMPQAMLRICRTGEMYVIVRDSTSLGKSAECDIVIGGNNKVSRRHALIENMYGSYYLFDQNSTNGTYLNDMPVGAGGVRLMPGDIIGLANEQIEFLQ